MIITQLSLAHNISISMRCLTRRSLTKLSHKRRLPVVQIPPSSWQQSNFSSLSFSSSTTSSSRQRANIKTASALHDKNELETLFSQFPSQYLRGNDEYMYDPQTLQRNDIKVDANLGKAQTCIETFDQNVSVVKYELIYNDANDNANANVYHVEWSDSRITKHSSRWIDEQLQLYCSSTGLLLQKDAGGYKSCQRQPWTGLTESIVRSSPEYCMHFGDVVLSDETNKQAIRTLYKYGILLVTNTPIHGDDGAGIAALGAALGGGAVKNESSLVPYYRSQRDNPNKKHIISLPHGTDGPLKTLYGTVWSTTSGAMVGGTSLADSAYGQGALPLHTDLTYYRDPPGLQIFTMCQPASISGGESVFGDGLAAAERLRRTDQRAFDVLSSTIRYFRCVDIETGWNLVASGPVIALDYHGTGQITAIRHNDLDRLPDLAPPGLLNADEIATFYNELQHAHYAWDEILNSDDIRLVIGLKPGETMVVANQRCFHGRHSFETKADMPRSVAGCYVGQDELSSRFRMEGLLVW